MKKILIVITVLVLAVAAFGSWSSRTKIMNYFEPMPEVTEQDKVAFMNGEFNPLEYAQAKIDMHTTMDADYRLSADHKLFAYVESHLYEMPVSRSPDQVDHWFKSQYADFYWQKKSMPFQILALAGLGVMWLVYGIWMKFGAAIKKYSVAAGRGAAKGWAWATTPRRLMIAGVLLLAVIATVLLV